MGKLTDIEIRNWVKAGTPVAKSDGDGLTFTFSAAGTAAWTLRYYVGSKRKEVTLGRYPDISLKSARAIALSKRAEVQQGVDVAATKQREKQETAHAWTFAKLVEDYFEKVSKTLAASTIKGRRQQLRDYVLPFIGHRAARDVIPADVVDIVERVAGKSLHVARLTLIAVREVFSHGMARHVLSSDPTAHVRAKAIIGPRPVSRVRIMLREGELRAMLASLPSLGRQNELMVKIMLATATRVGEMTSAEWSAVDLLKREWTLPKEITKNKTTFVIPLPEVVAGWFLELQALAFGSQYVLPIRKRRTGGGDAHMADATLNAALNGLCESLGDTCRRFTPHDLRSTCRSHLAALGVNLIVAERCLNHNLGGLVGVYDQHDYMTERRSALEKWAACIVGYEVGANVDLINNSSAL